MKSKEEVTRLVASLAGALLGIGVGLGLMMFIFQMVPWLSKTASLAPVLVILALCGGGLVGGGYLGLWLVTRSQRTQRRKYFDEKKKGKKGRK